jgi:hypothetical protein
MKIVGTITDYFPTKISIPVLDKSENVAIKKKTDFNQPSCQILFILQNYRFWSLISREYARMHNISRHYIVWQ